MSNIKKIQKMLKGEFGGKVQVGYTPKSVSSRKEGEEWVDPRGRRWIIEDGKRKQITKTDGIGWRHCSDCKKLILKTIDEQTYNRMERCYHCQINFEVDLKVEGKWEDWVIEQEKVRWESFLGELEEARSELDGVFDTDLSNALANEERTRTKRELS